MKNVFLLENVLLKNVLLKNFFVKKYFPRFVLFQLHGLYSAMKIDICYFIVKICYGRFLDKFKTLTTSEPHNLTGNTLADLLHN